jgi:hypothetical protein
MHRSGRETARGGLRPAWRAVVGLSAGVLVAFAAPAAVASTSETPRTGLRPNLTYDSQTLNDRHELAVNVASGNLVVRASDVRIAGRLVDLQVSRTFNALGDPVQATAGRRWTLAPGLDTNLET